MYNSIFEGMFVLKHCDQLRVVAVSLYSHAQPFGYTVPSYASLLFPKLELEAWCHFGDYIA